MTKSMTDNYVFFLNRLEPLVTTYTDKPSNKADYPYAVIKIDGLGEANENFDEFFVDIHLWHMNKTNNKNMFFATEDLADQIKSRLQHLREDGYIVDFINYLKVDDVNEAVHHRVIKYHARYMNIKDGGHSIL